MKRALVLYWSATGNTEKCALNIQSGLKDAGWRAELWKMGAESSGELEFYDYDLICLGAPSYNWTAPKPVESYLRGKFQEYKARGEVVPGAPKRPGKHALIFCTYSGPHTGMNEAVPAGKYMGQFFEHFGFTIADEWYILSDFIGDEANSTLGRMGEIRGLPSEADLFRLRTAAKNLAERL